MNTARVAGCCGTVLVHAALLAAMVASPAPADQPPVPTGLKSETDGLDDEGIRLLPSVAGVGLACSHSYIGIGVMVSSFGGLIVEVSPGGPADRAGMQIGDRFLNDAMFIRDQYEAGRELTLRMERDGQRIDLPVRVGRVCYDEGVE
jgi:predicted metalloprotease with PDZ domain